MMTTAAEMMCGKILVLSISCDWSFYRLLCSCNCRNLVTWCYTPMRSGGGIILYVIKLKKYKYCCKNKIFNPWDDLLEILYLSLELGEFVGKVKRVLGKKQKNNVIMA